MFHVLCAAIGFVAGLQVPAADNDLAIVIRAR